MKFARFTQWGEPLSEQGQCSERPRSLLLSLGECHPDPRLGPILGPSRSHPGSEVVPSRFAMCFVLQCFGPIQVPRWGPIPARPGPILNLRVVADVWKKDVREFQAKSGSSGSCHLFLNFLGKSQFEKCLGKRLEVPDILLPDIRGLLNNHQHFRGRFGFLGPAILDLVMDK